MGAAPPQTSVPTRADNVRPRLALIPQTATRARENPVRAALGWLPSLALPGAGRISELLMRGGTTMLEYQLNADPDDDDDEDDSGGGDGNPHGPGSPSGNR